MPEAAVLAAVQDTLRRVLAPSGVSLVVAPALGTLDAIYATQAVLLQQASRYGDLPQGWPPGVIKQLRERNSMLFSLIERRVCSMQTAAFNPLGAQCVSSASRADAGCVQKSLRQKHAVQVAWLGRCWSRTWTAWWSACQQPRPSLPLRPSLTLSLRLPQPWSPKR